MFTDIAKQLAQTNRSRIELQSIEETVRVSGGGGGSLSRSLNPEGDGCSCWTCKRCQWIVVLYANISFICIKVSRIYQKEYLSKVGSLFLNLEILKNFYLFSRSLEWFLSGVAHPSEPRLTITTKHSCSILSCQKWNTTYHNQSKAPVEACCATEAPLLAFT